MCGDKSSIVSPLLLYNLETGYKASWTHIVQDTMAIIRTWKERHPGKNSAGMIHSTLYKTREPGTSESSPRPIVELTTHCSALSLQLKPRALLLLLPPVCIVLSVINHWRGNSATSPWLSPSSCSAGRFHLRSGTFRLYLPSLRSSLALFPSTEMPLFGEAEVSGSTICRPHWGSFDLQTNKQWRRSSKKVWTQ